MPPFTPVNQLPPSNSDEWFDYEPDYVRLHHPDHPEGRLLVYASLSAMPSGMRRGKSGDVSTKKVVNMLTKRLTKAIEELCLQQGINPIVFRACYDEMRRKVAAYYDKKRGTKSRSEVTAQRTHRLCADAALSDKPTIAELLEEAPQETAPQNWWVKMAEVLKTYSEDKAGKAQLANDWKHKHTSSAKGQKKRIIEIAEAIEKDGIKHTVDDIAAEVHRLFPERAWTRGSSFLAELFSSGTALSNGPVTHRKTKDGKQSKANNCGSLSNTGKGPKPSGGKQQQTIAPSPSTGSDNGVKRKRSEPKADPTEPTKRVKMVDRGTSPSPPNVANERSTAGGGGAGQDLSLSMQAGGSQPPQYSPTGSTSWSGESITELATSASVPRRFEEPASTKTASSSTPVRAAFLGGDDDSTPGSPTTPAPPIPKRGGGKQTTVPGKTAARPPTNGRATHRERTPHQTACVKKLMRAVVLISMGRDPFEAPSRSNEAKEGVADEDVETGDDEDE